MGTHDELHQLIQQLREGNLDAAATLSERYREIVQDVIGSGLAGTKLGRKVSNSDMVQSGMVQILNRLDLLAFGVDNIPAYLRTMARNKRRERLREHTTQKRDFDKEISDENALEGVPTRAATPSDIVVTEEEYDAVLSRLSAHERTVVEAWLAGYSWAEVAEQTGQSSPDAPRKTFERARTRLREQFADGSNKAN